LRYLIYKQITVQDYPSGFYIHGRIKRSRAGHASLASKLSQGWKSDEVFIYVTYLNEYFPVDKASAYMAEIQKDLQGLLAP
jgi:hypothetical protein